MKKKVIGDQYYTFYANEIKMHASEHFKRHPPYSTYFTVCTYGGRDLRGMEIESYHIHFI
jgi:hypothetical protein